MMLIRMLRYSALLLATGMANTGAYADELTSAQAVIDAYSKKLVVTKDLDEEVREYLKGKPELTNPGVVRLDINGDGVEDVALLTKEKKSEELWLRIFLCTSNCQESTPRQLGHFDGIQYIGLIKAGSIVSQAGSLPGANVSKRLKNPAVAITYSGKGKVVYYWEESEQKVKSIQASD